jgi:ABC-type uncharacterized transport system permease subunit
VVDAVGPNHSHLIHLPLLLENFIGPVAVAEQHLHLVLLILLELSQLLLLGLDKDLLEDELVLLLPLGWEGSVRALSLLLVCEAHGVSGADSLDMGRLLEQGLVNGMDPLLLLLVLGDFLRPDDTV